LKKEKKNAYGECRKNFNDTVRFLVEHYPNVGFTKCKVKRIVNLFEDTGSVREVNYRAEISRSCFSPNVVFNFVNVCKVSKVNVKYVTCASAKRDDQNSAKLGICFIRVYVFAFAATFNTVFCFFLANQTSFKDEFFPTVFFIDDQFFM
jgi:hypothetical protein